MKLLVLACATLTFAACGLPVEEGMASFDAGPDGGPTTQAEPAADGGPVSSTDCASTPIGACHLVGTWKLTYSAYSGTNGCAPVTDTLVISEADGGLIASLGFTASNGYPYPPNQVEPTRSYQFDLTRCEVKISESIAWFYSGETQSDERVLTLGFGGDRVTGGGTSKKGALCPSANTFDHGSVCVDGVRQP